jgi:predicted regulator of Ras-like GTPase activity (Roadblock/LC7/MglB family)
MGIQGSLTDMSVADLIQLNCQDRRTVKLTIKHDDQEAIIWFKDGNVIHSSLGSLDGEEVIYRILSWQQGKFDSEIDKEAPTTSVNRSWTSLLLEGAKRLDEQSTEVKHTRQHQQEVIPMAVKKKGELLADTLSDLLQSSNDIDGAAVVGIDGLVYSINVPVGGLDETLVGAVGAAALGISKRSTEQLKRGVFTQTLVQADKGNIFVSQVDPETLFVALTGSGVNLGMVFAEVRATVGKLREIL